MYKTKEQGNIGLGQAIAYFTSLGLVVSVPLNDSQKYDLVVDVKGDLRRVSVKTSSFVRRGNFYVLLKQAGGTRKAATSTPFDPATAELLFIWCSDGSRYLIPCKDITVKGGITLCSKYDAYRLP